VSADAGHGRAAALRADLATLVTLFVRELRAAGIPAGTAEAHTLARVVGVCRPTTVDELYWCARVSTVRTVEAVPAFDAVFALVFRGLVDVADQRGQSAPLTRTRAPAPPEGEPAEVVARETVAGLGPRDLQESGLPRRRDPAPHDEGGRREVRAVPALASSEERLTRADFGQLSEEELDALAPLLHRLLLVLPLRRSRRLRRSPTGRVLDIRATLRHSTRSGGDPTRVVRRSRRRRPRRIVALLDVSGSMQPYARAYLHLLWGAAVRADAEVFAFGTRLTRLTRVLRVGGPDRALRRAVGSVPDWAGGTRIGHALRLFLDHYGRRGMAHGAVLVIVSDGWERDDPAVLRAQMQALAARAHRVVWVNPRAAAPGFAPQTGGMAAALPYVDALVSGHSAEAFVEVLAAASGPRSGLRASASAPTLPA
jgi:uncharacterized protein with von Willebrand factor type A (vWA) domain